MTGSTNTAATRAPPPRSNSAAPPPALDLALQRLERVVRHMRGVRVERAHALLVRGDPADRGAQPVRAVVALRAPDQVRARRLVHRGEVAAGELRGGVDRVPAAGAQEDA